ncbi:MAG: pentapeptide repeat-containing protein, partial [Boseongicola sp. SB0670_bin_30]|nr:pentapeptide repeat-containing protein [Boseongicola sp. SB0670_bin_30]
MGSGAECTGFRSGRSLGLLATRAFAQDGFCDRWFVAKRRRVPEPGVFRIRVLLGCALDVECPDRESRTRVHHSKKGARGSGWPHCRRCRPQPDRPAWRPSFKIFLSKSNLRSANLGNAVIQDANFMEADLRNANLADVRLEGTNLIGARLDSAKIENSSFRRADLSAATVSQLTNVDLSEATFTVADLSQSSLMSSKFTDSFLLGADLSDASLDDVALG